jgi:hypothetical protein
VNDKSNSPSSFVASGSFKWTSSSSKTLLASAPVHFGHGCNSVDNMVRECLLRLGALFVSVSLSRSLYFIISTLWWSFKFSRKMKESWRIKGWWFKSKLSLSPIIQKKKFPRLYEDAKKLSLIQLFY